jgi:filamentous hemagglutinin
MDLCGAICRDTDVLKNNLLNKGYDPKLVNETVEAIIQRNKDRGIGD